ncbi:MAG: N-terminal acetyltransferase A complex catalytic subunit ard1, partial [Pleopsidium flavum]
VEKIEAKYYADGEDAYSMKMDLSYIRDQALDAESDREDVENGTKDEGDDVGDVGKKGDGEEKEKKGKGKKRKVKVGRGLGVGDLVERNESQH